MISLNAIFGRWRDSRDGNVTVMFGLLLLPVVAMLGIGVDVARSYTAKIRFDSAVANATRALSASPAADSPAVIQRRVQAYLDLAYRSSAPGQHVALRLSDPSQPMVRMEASASVKTTAMQLVGVNSMGFGAATVVARRHPPGSDETQEAAAPGQNNGDWSAQGRQSGFRPGLWLDPHFRSR